MRLEVSFCPLHRKEILIRRGSVAGGAGCARIAFRFTKTRLTSFGFRNNIHDLLEFGGVCGPDPMLGGSGAGKGTGVGVNRTLMMRILFIHQNFPGQFKHLAPALAARGDDVRTLTLRRLPQKVWQGVEIVNYGVSRGSTMGIHPWLQDFETKTIRGEACFRAACRLRDAGFVPDLIISHPGWGESLFLKDVWPQAKLAIYCELFYRAEAGDVGFDPEFSSVEEGDVCRIRLKNLNNLLHFEVADAGISPTRWQADTFPEPFRQRISVIHDGIDTRYLVPNPDVTLTLNHTLVLSRRDEIITFVNRNLEPYRGYHIFMRALPELLRRRPRARVLIVGGDKVSYGPPPKQGGSWKEIFIKEVRPRIPAADWARVHFLGNIPYNHFVALLQLTTAHVYLTYPFVLSWSLLEAMSIGCPIVASSTPPVREVITDGVNGHLVDFFRGDELLAKLSELLDDAASRRRLGAAARETARTLYDLRTVCLPQQLAWVDSLIA